VYDKAIVKMIENSPSAFLH